jgi:putative Holliday junction resolvase
MDDDGDSPTSVPPAVRRVVALDLGKARVGVAMSDDLGLLAHPRPAFSGRDQPKLLASLRKLAHDEGVDLFVVGLPLSMSGRAGVVAERAVRFCEKLAKQTAVEVELVDERLTTVQAERALIEAGYRRDTRKTKIDSAAAALMLQQWLDARRGDRLLDEGGGEPGV